MKQLNAYEREIIRNIAHNMVTPSRFHELMATVGKPVDWALKIPKLGPAIKTGINKGIKSTVKIASVFYDEQTIIKEYQKALLTIQLNQIPQLELENIDQVANSFETSNKWIMGAEGLGLGVATSICEIVPGAQVAVPWLIAADITASFTFLSRHACCIAMSYGLDPRKPENLIHILSSMVPVSDTTDEGFIAMKLTAIREAKAASEYASKKVLEGPAIIRFIEMVAARLQVVITEKQLMMLVPLVGGVVNGSVNVTFLHFQHQTAMDYHRKLYLEKKYGFEAIKKELDQQIKALKEKAAA